MAFINSDNNGYRFEIWVNSGEVTFENYITRFTEAPEISYNADNFDNESLFFPSSLKLKFWSNVPDLLDYLGDPLVYVLFYEGSDLIFRGKIDIEETLNPFNTKLYSLTFLDKSRELADVHYTQFSALNNNTIYSLVNMLCVAMGYTGAISNPPGSYADDYLDMRFDVDNYFKAKSDFYVVNPPGYYEGGFDKMGTYGYYFFEGRYKTAFEIIRSVLHSCGLIGFFVDNKLVILPRFVENSPTVINRYDFDSELNIIADYDYITADVRTSSPGVYAQMIYDHRANSAIDPKKSITQKYELCGGLPPSGSYFMNVSIFVAPDNQWYYCRENSFQLNGGTAGAAWRILADAMDSRLSIKRKKLSTKIYSTQVILFETIQVGGRDYIVSSISRKLGEQSRKVTALSV